MRITLPLFDFIAYARRKQNMTQAEVAKRAGVSRNYIGQIERGEADVTLITLQKVCDALGFDLTMNMIPKDNEK